MTMFCPGDEFYSGNCHFIDFIAVVDGVLAHPQIRSVVV
jgi:hypothetical protein